MSFCACAAKKQCRNHFERWCSSDAEGPAHSGTARWVVGIWQRPRSPKVCTISRREDRGAGRWPLCQFTAEILVRPARERQRTLCCSFADGFRVDDVDWDTQDGHYRVRLNGEWIVVPDNAVVSEPNMFGPAVVWPYMGTDGQTQIRCFLPGTGA